MRVAHRRRGRGRAAGVAELLPIDHVFVDKVLHEEPRALVLRFVLTPHDFGRVREPLQLGEAVEMDEILVEIETDKVVL